jgi:RNA-directed DNA polymerase
MSREIRRWALHHRSDKSLEDLATKYNRVIQCWINYYGNFYRTKLSSTLRRIDAFVIRWARRKFKSLRRLTKGARDWFDRLRRSTPRLVAHWQLCYGNGRTIGAA